MTDLAEKLQGGIENTVLKATAALQASVKVAEVAKALESGSFTGADDLDWETYESELSLANDDLNVIYVAAARMAQSRIPEELLTDKAVLRKADVAIAGRFDMNNHRSLEFLQNEDVVLVEATANTKETVQHVLAQGYAQGKTPYAVAQQIRSTVGLTSKQAIAAINYETKLNALTARRIQAMSKSTQDMLRKGGIRSNQFNRIKREGLRAGEVQKLAANYIKRTLKRRAMTIARTAAINAAAAGQLELWQQSAEQGLIEVDRTYRVWNVRADERLDLVICAPMSQQEVPFEEPFTTGDGRQVMRPTVHPN